jgi:hypothetical protein
MAQVDILGMMAVQGRIPHIREFHNSSEQAV